MSTKYVLNQFGKLSKSQHLYATKKFNKYTKNIQLNPSIRNSLIIPVSSKIKMPIFQKDKLLKSLSKKKQNNLTQKTNFPLEKTIQNSAPVISVVSSEKISEPPTVLNNTVTSVPVYGCLKNGSLPTFREFKNKTIKKPS